jgi:hypothetical protein
MELSASEEVLLEAFRRLPQAAADELAELAQRLAGLPPNAAIDWSDSWSEADLQEFTDDSFRRLDAEEQETPVETRRRDCWHAGRRG